jgi:hypothetical protein
LDNNSFLPCSTVFLSIPFCIICCKSFQGVSKNLKKYSVEQCISLTYVCRFEQCQWLLGIIKFIFQKIYFWNILKTPYGRQQLVYHPHPTLSWTFNLTLSTGKIYCKKSNSVILPDFLATVLRIRTNLTGSGFSKGLDP